LTRAPGLEANFFKSLDISFEWRTETSPDAGWQAVKNLIDDGIPVLCHADIFYLEHYNSKTHFPLHVILLVGYDIEKEKAYIVDTGWEGFLELPLASLSRARYSKDSFFQINGDYFPGKLPSRIDGMERRVKTALSLQADHLSDSSVRGGGWAGYEGMRKAGEKLGEWANAKDASWCFRWAYQIIERRGTGGGAFRKLYAGFLKEVNQLFPDTKAIAPFEKMEIIANKWTELAMQLKQLSEMTRISEPELKKAGKCFQELADEEEEFFETAKEKLGKVRSEK